MSSESQLIVCRRCKEAIPIEDGACPHCGAGIRSRLTFGVVVLFGLLLIGAAALAPSELMPFGILGFLLVAGGGYILYDRRQRIQRAAEGGGR